MAQQCTPTGWQCVQQPGTPILIDTTGQGFHLTSVADGVYFTFFLYNPPKHMTWTDPAFGNGWLALDRNGNGTIDDGTELFGNVTAQPLSNSPNGFKALAVFDNAELEGNENGYIDPGDEVYPKLRVWIDANQNAISEPGELHSLQELGIQKIGLAYTTTSIVDSNGNRFRYKSKLWDNNGKAHETCYDVILVFGR